MYIDETIFHVHPNIFFFQKQKKSSINELAVPEAFKPFALVGD